MITEMTSCAPLFSFFLQKQLDIFVLGIYNRMHPIVFYVKISAGKM